MIDTKELRRLAQAATPNVGRACKYQNEHWIREGHVDFDNADLFIASERPQEDAEFYAAANPAAISELLDRLEAAEKERDALRADLEKERKEHGYTLHAAEAEAKQVDRLRAKITEMERQEPVAWMKDQWSPDCGNFWEIYSDDEMGWRDRKDWVPLYALPGAQIGASVPDAVMAALESLDDYIARIEGNDRGACGLINLVRRYLLDAAEVGGNK